MPLAELVQPQRDKKGAIDRPIGLVTCPNCRVVMPRISLQPSQEENLHEAVYRCPQCGTETRRGLRSDAGITGV
jgi:Zn finger protein HypA/HybF involved in hydrogenase expression